MAKFTCIPPVKGSNGEVSGGSAVPKLKYASDNTTALGIIPKFDIPDGKIDHLTAKFQRFCGWCEEFAVTIYWPICYMTVLGNCNSMFGTLVRIIAALKVRFPGIKEDPITVDCSIPAAITLNCEVETLADKQSLLCTSEEPSRHAAVITTAQAPVTWLLSTAPLRPLSTQGLRIPPMVVACMNQASTLDQMLLTCSKLLMTPLMVLALQTIPYHHDFRFTTWA